MLLSLFKYLLALLSKLLPYRSQGSGDHLVGDESYPAFPLPQTTEKGSSIVIISLYLGAAARPLTLHSNVFQLETSTNNSKELTLIVSRGTDNFD